MRFRRKVRPKVYWSGNASSSAAGITPCVAVSASVPVSFQLSLFQANSFTFGSMQDAIQYGVRIRRMVGKVSLRAVSSSTLGSVSTGYRVRAAVLLMESSITASGVPSNVEGGVAQQFEQIDLMGSVDPGGQQVALQRRILWWRQWMLAPVASTLSADYLSTTDSFLTPQTQCVWDVKCNIPLQDQHPTIRRLSPWFMVWFHQAIGANDPNFSLEIDDTIYRTLWQPMPQFRR